MRCEIFRGSDLRQVFDLARHSLGEDAMIVHSSITRAEDGPCVELTAATAEDVERLRAHLSPPPARTPRRAGGWGDLGPLVVALIGPTGAGKTTTAAKLALSAEGFRGRRVGLLTLDTFRIGALEQTMQIAEIAQLPVEMAYDADDVPRAMQRLELCDVVIVDTPGRSPRMGDENARWQAMLRAAAPDEVHLVVPGATRPEAASMLRTLYAPARPAYLLLSKADELPEQRLLLDLVTAFDLPVRWVTDGQEIPRDLHAGSRLMSAIGQTSAWSPREVAA